MEKTNKPRQYCLFEGESLDDADYASKAGCSTITLGQWPVVFALCSGFISGGKRYIQVRKRQKQKQKQTNVQAALLFAIREEAVQQNRGN